MSKRIKIKNHKRMSINALKNEYIRPDYVYIPLISHIDQNCELLVKIGDKVNKGTMVGKRISDDFPIFSTVSGVVSDLKPMQYFNGKIVDTVVIKNDFKEKNLKTITLNKDISKISKKDFIKKLKKNAVTGLSGNDLPSYLKYDTNKKLNILLVNGAECEPYLTSNYYMMRQQSEEILETIDAIISIMNLERAVLVFKNKTKDIKKLFESIIGTYPNIEMITVKDYYPVGWERNLLKDVLHLTYEYRANEVGVITSNVSTIYEIYQTLKYNKPLTEKYITISGEAIREPQNILVKIGTKIEDVVNHIGGFEDSDDLIFITNGPLMGKSLANMNTMVVKGLSGIVITKNIKEVPLKCIKCGKCAQVCPVNLTPSLIRENINNPKMLKKLHAEKCIKCGLCSFVCPSKINVREDVNKAIKEMIK